MPPARRIADLPADRRPRLLVGHGYDLHRLAPIAPAGPGRPLVLGGVPMESDVGPVAHSDGDALLHALTDAILGALAEPDIGQLFPETNADHESQDSADFLAEAVHRLRAAGYELLNADCTVILQRPKLRPVKESIRDRLAELLRVEPAQVNVKGKTHEGVDAVGEGRAVEVHVVVMVKRATERRSDGAT